MRKRQINIRDKFHCLDVPSEVAVCPDCHEPLSVTAITGWEKDEDGEIVEIEINLACAAEPDEEEEEAWGEWECRHYNMPYVNWLPVYEKVEGWMLRRYEIYDGPTADKEKELLAKWVAACSPIEAT